MSEAEALQKLWLWVEKTPGVLRVTFDGDDWNVQVSRRGSLGDVVHLINSDRATALIRAAENLP